MELQVKRETNLLLYISLHQIKPAVPKIDYILSTCWPKVTHGIPKTTQAIVKPLGSSPQTHCKALLLKTAFMHLMEHGAVEPVLPRTFTTWTSVHCHREYLADCQNKSLKKKHLQALQTTMMMSLQEELVQ